MSWQTGYPSELHIKATIKPSGQFVCPVLVSFGNADTPMAKKVDVKDKGSYNITA
jgi:hypothetical protein